MSRSLHQQHRRIDGCDHEQHGYDQQGPALAAKHRRDLCAERAHQVGKQLLERVGRGHGAVVGDPGEHDHDGNRIYRKDGVPAGEPTQGGQFSTGATGSILNRP